MLRSQGMPVRLRAVGDFETAEYRRQVVRLGEDLGLAGAVDWVGFQRDVDSQLAQMDLFVLPSLFGEGLPMVLLEAMSAGLPVISTRVEGIPEAVRDGREGLLAEPGDANELAAAIGRVVCGQVDWHCAPRGLSGTTRRAVLRDADGGGCGSRLSPRTGRGEKLIIWTIGAGARKMDRMRPFLRFFRSCRWGKEPGQLKDESKSSAKWISDTPWRGKPRRRRVGGGMDWRICRGANAGAGGKARAGGRVARRGGRGG